MYSVNEALNSFRRASRELFNTYFRGLTEQDKSDGWALTERFDSVEQVLFAEMLAPSFSKELQPYGVPQQNLRVSLLAGGFAPIMLNRELKSGYWDHPVHEVSHDVVMSFVRFFDWDQLAIRDGRYVEVVIDSWPGHPELENKHALIETLYAKCSEA